MNSTIYYYYVVKDDDSETELQSLITPKNEKYVILDKREDKENVRIFSLLVLRKGGYYGF